jgi:Flp pilus assembly protein TadD
VLSAGCGTSAVTLERHQLGEELTQRGVDPKLVILPFGLTDEMREWARANVPNVLSDETKLEVLRDRLLDSSTMSVEYEWGYTGTAIEVFEKRRANCLAFTNLFVGMARELGLPVYFLAVDDTETYRREGDLVVVSDHIAVGYGAQTNRKIYDFSQYAAEADYRSVHKVSDLTAIAMFHSNRGAEALRVGNVRDSFEWLRTAVTIDPELVNAWVNLGVTLRRGGQLEAAEQAYKRAIEIDPRVYSAYNNLASVLRLQGRKTEAEAFEAQLEKSPNRNPFTYLALGDISLRNGRLAEAERFYRRAINLRCEEADCYAALGQLAVANGNLKTARKMLSKAEKLDPNNERTQRLARSVAEHEGRAQRSS